MLRNTNTVGKYIGGYHITLDLAVSSSSRVFLGESVSPDRHNVAIKRFYAIHLASRQDQDSFLREASLLKQFDHPYILLLLSADVIKGTPYVVNEYAPNGSLRDRLQRQAPEPMDQDEALTILSQIGQALHYAHQRNRVHGNLKPQNILFNEKGDALLADFKFTSLSSPISDAVVTSSATHAYMSPEQIDGIISKENDQYSLGCIAYEMFTGRKPFTTPSFKKPGIYYKTRTLIAPRKLNPALPERIEQAILKAMAKEPSQRYGSVMEFIKALGTPGILIVPDVPPVLSPIQENEPAHAPKQYCFLGRPKFPGLKVATAGATTLAQFTAKAALFRNTFNSLTNFSTRAWSNRRSANPLSARGKREIPRPLLVIATLLFIIAGAVGMVFAFSPSRMQPGNNASTGTGITSGTAKTVVPQPQRTSSVTAGPTPKARGGITLPAQPTPPLQPRPTPPLPVTPTTTVVSTTGLSVAPTSLNATNCVHGNGSYTCNVVLSLGSRAGSSQSWYTYSIGTAANFSPSNGTIAPGQSMNVKITVFASCTKTGTFVFVSTKTNVTVAWSC